MDQAKTNSDDVLRRCWPVMTDFRLRASGGEDDEEEEGGCAVADGAVDDVDAAALGIFESAMTLLGLMIGLEGVLVVG